jgi:hypothetical protein
MSKVPAASIVRGVAAGAVGTLAMDALLYRRYRKAGGRSAFRAWELSEGADAWETAPAPARVAKRLLEGVTRREVPARYVRPLNNVMHWGFGLANGAAYGLPFGAAVWAAGYAVLPQLGVYRQIWDYDLETLEKDLGAHLVFGTATAAAFSILAPTTPISE